MEAKRRWKTEIELVYRVFVRQFEDVNLKIRSLRDELEAYYPVRGTFSYPDEEFWPLAPEKEAMAKSKGLFITYVKGKPHVVVREMKAVILCDSFGHAEELLDEIQAFFGEAFALIRIVREYFTDIQAV